MKKKLEEDTFAGAIERYLKTGQHDLFPRWDDVLPPSFLTRLQFGEIAMKKALIDEVRRREAGAKAPDLPAGLDLVAMTRAKVRPMVEGLFPKAERETILRVLEQSVIFITPANIHRILADELFLFHAWMLANLYLYSIGAKCLYKKELGVLGFTALTTSYISTKYFSPPSRFSDPIVHEAAHILQYCGRPMIGLPYTRSHKWLIEIDRQKKETFAYACEVYSRMLELTGDRRDLRRLFDKYAARGPFPSDARVRRKEFLRILTDAVAAPRNGWKRILRRCAQIGPRKAGPFRILAVK